MPNELPANISHDFLITHTQCILSSYAKWTGKSLIEPPQLPVRGDRSQNRELIRLAAQIFYAPFVIVTSNAATNPILNYGNQAGLDLWEMPWETFTQTPGQKTAEPMHRDERQKFLNTVQKNGFIDNYSGIRISSSGKRFKIKNALVWNLINENQQFMGQAATFTKWKYL